MAPVNTQVVEAAQTSMLVTTTPVPNSMMGLAPRQYRCMAKTT